MKRIFLLLFLLYWCSPVRAQYYPPNEKAYTDSLKAVIAAARSDSQKVMPGFLLTQYWLHTDTALAQQYYTKAIHDAQNSALLEHIGSFYQGLLLMENQPDSAALLFLATEKALRPFKRKMAYLYRAKSSANRAMIEKKKDRHQAYIDILLNQAIPMAVRAADSAYLGILYMDVAIGFKNMLDYPSADNNLKTALKILKTAHSPAEYLIPVYHTIAENAALSGHVTDAGHYLDTMKGLLMPYPDYDGWLDYYAGEGMYLTVAERFDDAIVQIDKGILLARKKKQSYPEQRLLFQKFYALYNKNAFTKAKEVMLSLMGRKEFMAIKTNRVQMYYGLALTYANLKDMHQAYYWMQRYSALNDSINQSNTLKNMAALDARFQTAEKEKRILALQSEKDRAALQNQEQKWTNRILLIICLFLLALAVASWFYYRKLARQKEINLQHQLREFKQQQQLQITQAMLDGEQKERKRVAQDLHDGLGGMLAAVKLNLSGIEEAEATANTAIAADKELSGVIEQLDNSITELRRIARNMMPDSLLKFGLEKALKDLTASYRTQKLELSLQTMGIQKDMPLSNQAHIFRIIQELIANAARHGNASQIFTQCSQNDGLFLITVEDNGIGFDPAILQQQKGLGYSNIKNRVAFLKGKIEIHSAAGEGTVINIELDSYA